MIKISKRERFELEKMGVRMGSDGISHTVAKSKKRTYYLTETTSNLFKLNKIRSND